VATRVAAANGFCALAGKNAAATSPYLRIAARDDRDEVRRAAAACLDEVAAGDPKGAARMAAELSESGEASVRNAAAEALGRVGGETAVGAAVQAGFTRLRPILMTACAMIIGMLPMALGMGEGGEQNAPLARAVIGGLSMATFATLFFVPLMFTLIHGKKPAQEAA